MTEAEAKDQLIEAMRELQRKDAEIEQLKVECDENIKLSNRLLSESHTLISELEKENKYLKGFINIPGLKMIEGKGE